MKIQDSTDQTFSPISFRDSYFKTLNYNQIETIKENSYSSLEQTTNKIEMTSKLLLSEPLALPQYNQISNNKSQKIDSLLISFDHIDYDKNTMEATSGYNIFPIKIINRTDIFKGFFYNF